MWQCHTYGPEVTAGYTQDAASPVPHLLVIAELVEQLSEELVPDEVTVQTFVA
jgi:hypothetical protein